MNGGTAVSIWGSIALGLAGIIVGWLVKNNILPAGQIDVATAVIGSIIAGAFATGIIWFKAWTSRIDAKIAAVNATKGIQVAPENPSVPPVTKMADVEPPK